MRHTTNLSKGRLERLHLIVGSCEVLLQDAFARLSSRQPLFRRGSGSAGIACLATQLLRFLYNSL